MLMLEDIFDLEKLMSIDTLNCDNESKEKLRRLIKDYKNKTKRLDKILKISDRQQLEIYKLNESLYEYKEQLEEQVKEENEKNKLQERLLIKQSKLAEMGQMIDAIAHQWSQPLSVIQLLSDSLIYEYQAGFINEDFIKKHQENITRQIKHLSSTLTEFRNFYRPNQQIENFSVKSCINKVLILIKDEFIKNQIEFELNMINDFEISGIENELKHLFLNLFNNTKDAFIDNNIEENKKISVTINKDKTIEIIDNAGGIPQNILDKIFELNFTTKQEGKGSGVGLYLCKKIVKKSHGTIDVSNVKDGAKFTISFA